MKNDKITKTFRDMSLGMNSYFERIVTEEHINLFSEVSGDKNPLHLDEDFAKKTIFGGRIAHGMLTASHISAAIVNFAGPGWIYINQSLKFRSPVRIGDRVDTYLEVDKLIPEKFLVQLSTVCSVDKTIIIEGSATIKSPVN